MDEDQKAPLGEMPEWRWRELRVRALVRASNRYATEDLLDTPERRSLVGGWMDEASRHIQWLLDHPTPTHGERKGLDACTCTGPARDKHDWMCPVRIAHPREGDEETRRQQKGLDNG